MAADALKPGSLKVDGGMARNDLFMQRLTDVLGIPIFTIPQRGIRRVRCCGVA